MWRMLQAHRPDDYALATGIATTVGQWVMSGAAEPARVNPGGVTTRGPRPHVPEEVRPASRRDAPPGPIAREEPT
jgi:hypothetical protein